MQKEYYEITIEIKKEDVANVLVKMIRAVVRNQPWKKSVKVGSVAKTVEIS